MKKEVKMEGELVNHWLNLKPHAGDFRAGVSTNPGALTQAL